MNKAETHINHLKENGGGSEDYYSIVVKDLNSKIVGDVELFICKTCQYIRVNCEHTENSWNITRDALTCNLCGMDVT